MAKRKLLPADIAAYEEYEQALEQTELPLAPLNRSITKLFNPDRSTRKQGRPSDYDEAFDEIVEALHMLGTRVVDICAILGISDVTYYSWAQKYTSFARAIVSGRELADARVAKSLYHRATGYSHPEEKIHISPQGDVTRVPTVRHHPPDTGAAIYWMNNRSRGKWKSTVDLTHQAPDGKQVDPSKPPLIKINATPPQPKD